MVVSLTMDRRKKLVFFKKAAFLCAFFLIFTSCENVLNFFNRETNADRQGTVQYYITGSQQEREDLLELFNLLETEEAGSESEFAVVREIAGSFARIGDYERLIHFLSERAVNHPEDPYNGYYFLMIAYAHIQLGSETIAALYFDLILMNYPDLLINNESIHLICLRNLINLNNDPERQVWYYRELILRFSDKIDLGTSYFMLGQACERVGDWNSALAAYTNYLPFTGAVITGFPNADRYARQLVDFSRSPKDWTFPSLNALVASVQAALDSGNVRTLMQYQAKVNFFARSWEQVETDEIGMARFNLALFMYGNRIRFSPTLDESSNATEAFLRTTGWAQSLNTWYLYFRKIYFPQDPDIHGTWEWAGIYYGEKF